MVEIRINGLNQLRLLNTLRKEEIALSRTRFPSPSEMRVCVRKKDLRKAVAILETMCYNYTVIQQFGGERRKRLMLRLPLIVACLVAIAAVFVSNGFVWRIEVDGADGALLLEVKDVVASCGVRAFSPKSSVDVGEIAAALRHTDGISAAAVSLEGNVLSVSVLTNEQAERPAVSEGDLVSSYDGVVTRIIVESGTAAVGVGDLVKRGDPLITGDLLSTADGTVIGRAEARGSVYATVTFGYSYPVGSEKMLKRTGNSETRTTVGLFGLTVGDVEPPYPLYETETRKETLDPLPVEVTHTTYYELGLVGAEEETETFMKEKADELNVLFGKTFASRYGITTINGVVVLKAYFTAEICIGEI